MQLCHAFIERERERALLAVINNKNIELHTKK
jgi:hypothetical protein